MTGANSHNKPSTLGEVYTLQSLERRIRAKSTFAASCTKLVLRLVVGWMMYLFWWSTTTMEGSCFCILVGLGYRCKLGVPVRLKIIRRLSDPCRSNMPHQQIEVYGK